MRYRAQGWDTAVTCKQTQIVLSVEPYIPVQFFNGTYFVTEIPYNPPDPTFYINYTGTDTPTKKKMNISADDYFAPQPVTLNFPFYFFGIKKTKFRLGDNGIVTFSDSWPANHANHYDATNNNKCDWYCPATLPWPSNREGGAYSNQTPFNYGTNCMRDAIYGVFQDTHLLPSTISGNQGIYYGLLGEFPCRKIIATWNDVPLFSSQTSNRQTYQIVCYEGTNIIEVHIQRRTCTSGTCDGLGLIGIQNATGQPQKRDSIDENAPNRYVVNGSPAAFWPAGWNPKSCSDAGHDIINKAYRFTPDGNTPSTCVWYRLSADGDSIPLSTNSSDPNGYYTQMNQYDELHPTLTKAYVSPTEPTRYVCMLYFQNANGDEYRLRDTIFVGVDTADVTVISPISGEDTAAYVRLAFDDNNENDTIKHVFKICQGQTIQCPILYTDIQKPERTEWNIKRILHGDTIALPEDMIDTSAYDNGCATAVTVNPDPHPELLPRNKIDSIYMYVNVDYVSGCPNFDTTLILIYPNFDTTDTNGICKGESFYWKANGRTYTESNYVDEINIQSEPGCDSIVHLHLTVFGVTHDTITVESCKEYTWINDSTYTESNHANPHDTLSLLNIYGCDSIVQLNFILTPVVARIKSSLSYFDYDHLDVELSDISQGGDSRRWLFPTGSEQIAKTAYYSIPYHADSANIKLIEHSAAMGNCFDTTSITIPFRKEALWMPNVFTPDDPTGNNTFGSKSKNTLSEEMYIYNRMGQLVFHCEGVDCQWDGRDLNGRPCVQGAYSYILRYTTTFEPGITKVLRGTVTIIR